MIKKSLLICGILSSLLYAAMNIIVAMQWDEYDSSAQTVSELSALGAPTRPLWVALGVVYSLLYTTFGYGVWICAGENRSLRITGILMIIYGIVSFAWPFAPMHLRGTVFTLTDTLHIILAIVTVFLMLLAIGFGAAAFGKTFRLYSIVSIAALFAFGALTGMAAPRIAENLPTPKIGIWERINIGVFLIWVGVLSGKLLRDGALYKKAKANSDA